MVYEQGDLYRGEWLSGLRHGLGKLMRGDEVLKRGRWADGVFAESCWVNDPLLPTQSPETSKSGGTAATDKNSFSSRYAHMSNLPFKLQS